MSEAKGVRGRYKTTNWAAYNAALKARGSLTIWLDKDMQWYAPANGRRGRQRVFSDAAIQFCLSIKCLFGLALRQSLGLVESLLVWRGWPGGCRTSAPCADARRHCGCNCPISPAPRRWTCWSIAPASSSSARANGSARNTGLNTVASGARCTWASTPTRWRFGPLR